MANEVRTLLFWTHLIAGCIAGAVILLMSVTGTMLMFERQMIHWADRKQFAEARAASGASERGERLTAGALLERVSQEQGGPPESLTIAADPAMPATVSFGRGKSFLVDPATGEQLGAAGNGMRRFLSATREWHRWLAMEGEGRATGKAITGASNALFLFLVLSGIYLWFPRRWSWRHVKPILLFRGGLRGKARDFNWHNVAGIWCAIPLAVVVLSAMMISYPAVRGWMQESGDALLGAGSTPAPAKDADGKWAAASLDEAISRLQKETPDWTSLSVALPKKAEEPVRVTISRGEMGQPQLRETILLAKADGSVLARERFEDLPGGRKVTLWMRFVHTGEYYGIAGQTVAGIASAGGALLVFTGIALALRRLAGWRRRTANGPITIGEEA